MNSRAHSFYIFTVSLGWSPRNGIAGQHVYASNSPKLLFLFPKYIQMKEHTDIAGQGHLTSHPNGWDLNLDVRLPTLGQGEKGK